MQPTWRREDAGRRRSVGIQPPAATDATGGNDRTRHRRSGHRLFNRRYFETRLDAEVERARRQGQDLALLLIDIDDFKEVNDTRGHLEGDRTLREVADLLRAGVRIFDVCARFGGEEFVIVMPDASVTVAQQVAERIRAQIERSFSLDAPRLRSVLASECCGNDASGEDLVEARRPRVDRSEKGRQEPGAD